MHSFSTTDGTEWVADPGPRLQVDTSSGLEGPAVVDPAVAQVATGSYLMVYVTEIPLAAPGPGWAPQSLAMSLLVAGAGLALFTTRGGAGARRRRLARHHSPSQ
ncbi:MAG: hypothetical protein HYV63_07090 [Candidatus Schekmanbacteria bacterium]|nr:hypothetical protein [Candidatus Schekmanbacteria bacterium]